MYIRSKVEVIIGDLKKSFFLKHPVGSIENYSWVRVREKDIFSRRVNRRPSDEEARSVRNKQGKDS